MKFDRLEVFSKRCKRCHWSCAYHNWTPPGAPTLPDSWFCQHPLANNATPDCRAYASPDEDVEAEGE